MTNPRAKGAEPAASRVAPAERRLTVSTASIVAAPASAVWEVLGPGFTEVSRWSSLNLASTPLPDQDDRRLPGAPPGRAVETPLGRFQERITAYDPVHRVLSFEVEGDLALAGLAAATDTWRITETGAASCRVEVDCMLTIHPDSTADAAEVRERVGAILARMIQELGHFAARGEPLP